MAKQKVDTDYEGRPVRTSFTPEEFAAEPDDRLAGDIDRIAILPDGTEAVEWPDGNTYPLDPETNLPDFEHPLSIE